MNQCVEKWDVFEVTVYGRSEGNPFVDYTICGTFTGEHETVTVDGFYDGDGIYKVRFMPAFEGAYTYKVAGTFSDEKTEGAFEVTPATSVNNHGRVQVCDMRHLRYEDGTPYYSIGTTCYVWGHQSMELQEQTLKTLSENAFNKIRFCFFPKYYDYNKHEPLSHPFEKGNGEGIDPELERINEENEFLFPGQQKTVHVKGFNYTRPNVEHYKRFDLRIRQLRDMGIEADIILMHPYDKWSMNMMNKECCDNYLRYVVARYGAYRNIWWSLANEWDLIKTKTVEDWERYAAVICEKDPYNHLRSIHNCMENYDHSRPWITHCSLQRIDFYRHVEYTDEFMNEFNKPVVWDEVGYEGNIQHGWGNLTPQEMVRRFWEAFLRGGHCGHGETYLDPSNILWWSHGGVLHGESQKRFAFLLEILKEVPGGYLKKTGGSFDEVVGQAATQNKPDERFCFDTCDYEIHYLGINQPAFRELFLPEDRQYTIDVIDTWNMTVTPAGVHSGYTRIDLPQLPYMALRIVRA